MECQSKIDNLVEKARDAIKLFRLKSRKLYNKAYDDFKKWCISNSIIITHRKVGVEFEKITVLSLKLRISINP